MHLFVPSLDIFCEIKMHGFGHDPLEFDDNKKKFQVAVYVVKLEA